MLLRYRLSQTGFLEIPAGPQKIQIDAVDVISIQHVSHDLDDQIANIRVREIRRSPDVS